MQAGPCHRCRRAPIQLDGRYATARHLNATLLFASDRVEEALAQKQVGAELEPLARQLTNYLRTMLLAADRPEEARRALEQAVRSDAASPLLRLLVPQEHRNEAWAAYDSFRPLLSIQQAEHRGVQILVSSANGAQPLSPVPEGPDQSRLELRRDLLPAPGVHA